MTAPGGSWAEAHVDVTLNFDDLDRELIRRLERSSQIAQRAVNRNLDKIAAGARRSFEKIGDSYDRQMDRLERRTGRAVANINRQLGTIGRNTVVDIDVRMTGATTNDVRALTRSLRRLQQSAGNIACRIDIQINSMAEIRDLDSALRRLPRRTSVDVDVDRRGSARAGLGKILGSVGGLAKGVLGVVGTFGKFAAIAGVATVAAGSLVPVIGALSSGLVAVGGAAGVVAVGGLMAVGVAAAALKTALTGVGDAAKVMFDPEKAEDFEEALAKLTPAAQSALRSFQKLGKQYADIVKTPVQETFFSGLGPKIAQLSRLLPAVRDSLVDVAQGFNDGANGALRMINSAKGMSMVKSLLADAGNMGANFGAAITSAIPGFLSLGSAAASVLSPMTDSIGGMAQRWSESMLQMQQDGTLQAKMQGLLDTAKQVGAALATVGSIIGGVFRAAAAAGDGNPLGNIQASLDTVSEWVNGPGQQALTSFFASVGQAMGTLMPIFLQIAQIIGGTVAPMIAELIISIGPALSQIVDGIGQGFAALGPAIGPLGQALQSIGQALAPVIPVVGELIAQFVQIAGPIVAELITALAPVVKVIGEGLTSALAALQPAIAPVSRIFQVLSPILAKVAGILADILVGAIEALVPVIEVMATAFAQVLEALSPLLPIIGDALMSILSALAPVLETLATAWADIVVALIPLIPPLVQIVEALLPPLVQLIGAVLPLLPMMTQLFAQLLPVLVPIVTVVLKIVVAFAQMQARIMTVIATVIGAVVGFVTGIVTNFTQMKDRATQAVSDLWTKVTGFFSELYTSVKTKVAEIWSNVSEGFSTGVTNAVNFVKELPGKIMDGLKDAGTWLVDTGKKVIGGLIDGIKSMGKAIVDALINLLPGPLQGAARTALGLAIGGWIPGLAQGGVLAMLGGGPIDTAATTPIKPGGFIVNARQTRRNRALLRALAPDGRVLSGPGTGTSDSITGMSNGRPVAKVSRGEYYVPPRTARRVMPQLTALNAGKRLAQLAAGGRIPYGLPAGSSGPVTADWVQALESKFGVKAATYPGHQEKDGKNKGIDWTGSVPNMQRFAEYLLGIKGDLEQVIWMNPQTGEQIGVADGQRVGPGTDQPGYYRDDWGGHQDHVHTRQSYAFGDGLSGSAPGIDDTSGLSTGSTSSSSGTPIGSGISSGSGSGSGSGSSWGNSGGGSRANSAVDAKRQGLTPVWVENWPATIGGSGGGLSTGTGAGGDLSTGTTGDLSTTGGAAAGNAGDATIELEQQPDGTWKAKNAAWDHLIQRESGGRADIVQGIQDANSGGNEASGLFQIAKGTWSGAGGTKYAPTAGEATPQQQALIAAKIFKRDGGSPWGAGLAGRESEDELRAGITTVPTTPAGNVPVEVQNTPTSTGDLSTTPTTTTPTSGQPLSASMPYGVARGNQYLREQNLGASLQDIGASGLKETFGEFGALIGVESFVERGIDEMVAYLKQIAEKNPKAEFKYADVVNINGGDPAQTKQQTTEGMTAVMDTYRQG